MPAILASQSAPSRCKLSLHVLDPTPCRRFPRRGYHHGNLREALIQAAQDLIGAKGPAGFTIAEAARLAGVSPAAPYRHFRDAESLLAEVATRGSTPSATAWPPLSKPHPCRSSPSRRGRRPRLPRVRSRGTSLLRRHVRGPHRPRAIPRPASRRRPRVRRSAFTGGTAGRRHAHPAATARADDRAASLVHCAWHRLIVRPGRTPRAAHCPCPPRICWRPRSSSTCKAWASQFRRNPLDERSATVICKCVLHSHEGRHDPRRQPTIPKPTLGNPREQPAMVGAAVLASGRA